MFRIKIERLFDYYQLVKHLVFKMRREINKIRLTLPVTLDNTKLVTDKKQIEKLEHTDGMIYVARLDVRDESFASIRYDTIWLCLKLIGRL